MKCLIRVAGLFIAVLLSACRVDVTADLYSEDLLESDSNIRFPAILEVEVPSCTSSDIAATEENLLSIFSSESDANISGCREDGFTSLLGVSFDGEIASEESEADLTIFRTVNDAGNNYFTAALNPNFRNRMNRLLDENMQKLEPSNLTFRIHLRHDIDEPSDLLLISGWIDGKVGQFTTRKLEKRDGVRLRFSNVISDMILNDKRPALFFLN